MTGTPTPAATLLVDASIWVFRAWFSLPATMTDPAGRQVNALYGFARFLVELLERERPAHLACAFDESLTTSFRNDLYPAYKANREEAPEALVEQFQRCRALCRALGVPELAHPRFEADDLIGSLMQRHRARRAPFVIVTRDKDLAQLLAPGDALLDWSGGQRTAFDEVAARFGVPPAQFADYLGLVGDSVDNIPGVPRVGPATARALLARFGSLDALYEDLASVAGVKVRGAGTLAARLAEHREQAFLSRALATIARDAPVSDDADALRRGDVDAAALRHLCDEAGFGEGLGVRAARLARDAS